MEHLQMDNIKGSAPNKKNEIYSQIIELIDQFNPGEQNEIIKEVIGQVRQNKQNAIDIKEKELAELKENLASFI